MKFSTVFEWLYGLREIPWYKDIGLRTSSTPVLQLRTALRGCSTTTIVVQVLARTAYHTLTLGRRK